MTILQIMNGGANDSIGQVINFAFNQFDGIAESAKVWMSIGKIVGSIAAYFYIFKKFGTKIMNGETFNLSDVGYPIFIAFFLSVYSPVATGIEKLFTSSYDGNYIAGTVGDIYNNMQKNHSNSAPVNEDMRIEADANIDVISPEQEKEAMDLLSEGEVGAVEEKGIIESATSMLMSGYHMLVDGINSVMFKIVNWFVEIFIVVCITVIFFISKLYISFLYIFGPFSIAMSLIPGFENSITNWFQKYIGYCLWMPIAATIADLTKSISGAAFTFFSGDGNVPALGNPSIITYSALLPTVILIVSMLAVPKIASNIIATSVGSSSTVNRVMAVANFMRGSGGKSGGGGTLGTIANATASGGGTIVADATNQIVNSTSDNSGNPSAKPDRPV